MHGGHAGLVLPPLFITMLFCFGLVFVQQQQANSQTAAAKQQAYNKAHTKLSPSSLKTIDTLQPIAVSQSSSQPSDSAAATNSSSGIKTSAPPQPSKRSGSEAQSAGQYSAPIKIDVPSTLHKATNLLGL